MVIYNHLILIMCCPFLAAIPLEAHPSTRLQMNQSNEKWILRDERVYEIDKTSSGAYRPLVVAITSKTSAQRLMAQLAEERGLQDQGRYRMFAFTHPTLPGLERPR